MYNTEQRVRFLQLERTNGEESQHLLGDRLILNKSLSGGIFKSTYKIEELLDGSELRPI